METQYTQTTGSRQVIVFSSGFMPSGLDSSLPGFFPPNAQGIVFADIPSGFNVVSAQLALEFMSSEAGARPINMHLYKNPNLYVRADGVIDISGGTDISADLGGPWSPVLAAAIQTYQSVNLSKYLQTNAMNVFALRTTDGTSDGMYNMFLTVDGFFERLT